MKEIVADVPACAEENAKSKCGNSHKYLAIALSRTRRKYYTLKAICHLSTEESVRQMEIRNSIIEQCAQITQRKCTDFQPTQEAATQKNLKDEKPHAAFRAKYQCGEMKTKERRTWNTAHNLCL